jgi:hypothetical protein
VSVPAAVAVRGDAAQEPPPADAAGVNVNFVSAPAAAACGTDQLEAGQFETAQFETAQCGAVVCAGPASARLRTRYGRPNRPSPGGDRVRRGWAHGGP